MQNIYVSSAEGKRKYSSLTEASVFMERLIPSSDYCVSPVPPPSLDEDGNCDTDLSMDDDGVRTEPVQVVTLFVRLKKR